MSAIPRAVREQIEALRQLSGAREIFILSGPEAFRRALDLVENILDAADREAEDARRTHFEGDDVLRKDPAEVWVGEEIDRLTEALAAAKLEASDNAEDRDHKIDAAPSPLVALASAIARGPMGQGLVAWLDAETGRALRVDTARTADNVLAVARAILGATS